MAWEEWNYYKFIIPSKSDGMLPPDIDGLREKLKKPKAELVIFINDDSLIDEIACKSFCEDYLSLNNKECPTDLTVDVFFSHLFEVGIKVSQFIESNEVKFNGIIQDLIQEDNHAFSGEMNVERARQSNATPPVPTLVVTSSSAHAKGYRDNQHPLTYAISKDPDIINSSSVESKQIISFFDHALKNKDNLEDEIGEYTAGIIGYEALAEIKEFVSYLEGDKGIRTPVVLLGESGTGKEAVARYIHAKDRSTNNPLSFGTKSINDTFVPVLIQGIPSSLLEGELVGVHALTPSEAEKYKSGEGSPLKGYIAQAEKGTLFLDEAAYITLQAQGALMRFLQDQSIRPLGGKEVKVDDVRSVFASNLDIAASEAEKFRRDFLYRIDGLTLRLKPLIERKNDHEQLVDYFIGASRARIKTGLELPYHDDVRSKILELCASGGFPGNIRQLEMFINRMAMVVRSGEIISMKTFEKAKSHSLIQPVGV